MQICAICGKEKTPEMFENIYRFKNAKELRCNECMSEYRKKYQKKECYLVMLRAFTSGKLTRPDNCSMCKKKCVPDAHHEDYDKPIEVIFLCKRCHYDIHVKKRSLQKK